MSIRKPMVAGNWKMNGSLELVKDVEAAVSGLSHLDVVVSPPFPYLAKFDATKVALAGQNMSQFDSGAHTGDVSANILKEFGCHYVILGHSERRADHHESDEVIAEKVKTALEQGLTPILCFGESESQREDGSFYGFLSQQLEAVIEVVGIAQFANLVLAYEPIWAIGTGKTASPEQAQDVHAFVRNFIAQKDANVASGLRILYGGSVKADNAKLLFSQADVDGGLIGGASLKVEDFVTICHGASE